MTHCYARLLALVALIVLVASGPAFAQTDYDTDNDNLIDVTSLLQLNAIRYDLNGDGAVANTDTADYNAAFPNAATGMGCAATCTGYELLNNLDFDTNGDGTVTSADDYPNWTPIGSSYSATFDGNAHTISNLTINSTNTTISTGLFNTLGSGGVIRNVGIIDATVSGRGGSNRGVAILVGVNDGTVSASYIQGGSVTATSQTANLGGLVGRNNSIITTSYSRASVSGNLYNSFIGGLVGTVASSGRVIASYAAGSVSGNSLGGGTTFGGFFGRTVSTASITNSYCDTQAAGQGCNGTRASGSTANAPATPPPSYKPPSPTPASMPTGTSTWTVIGSPTTRGTLAPPASTRP